jgi:hypothetical protein
MTEILTKKISFSIHGQENDNLNNTNIEIEKRKNKPRKNIKIKSYCGKCFQYFENGPFSKKCREHLKKKCNIIPCQKKKNINNECIRLFPNKNSANRHTHCISKDDIKLWDKQYEIQLCLGTNENNKFFEVPIKDNIFNNNNNDGFDFFNDDSFTTNNVGGIIERFDQLNVDDSFEMNKIFPSIQDDNGNINNNVIANNNNNYNLNNNNNNLIREKSFKNLKGSFNFSINENKRISNEETIENFFELVQKETFISNSVKKKLVKAFKNIGIMNVKILKLFHEKYKGWDFLLHKFKDVFPEIEGVSLCIEYLFKYT